MKYFLDTEFIEGFRKPLFGKSRYFIDLISIGIVAEDGREYYAISNEFDLKRAWKDDWLRENILLPIWKELCSRAGTYVKTYHHGLIEWSYKGLKNLIRWHGKSNKEIAQNLLDFFGCGYEEGAWYAPKGVEVYAYYADYDWVLFCSLFGRMIDLPKGFPMYCRDLKQMMDEGNLTKEWKQRVCPDPINEHNALVDAKWNYLLFKAIEKEIANYVLSE